MIATMIHVAIKSTFLFYVLNIYFKSIIQLSLLNIIIIKYYKSMKTDNNVNKKKNSGDINQEIYLNATNNANRISKFIILLLVSIFSGIIFGLPTFKHLIKVGTGFTALTVCTGRFISQRNDNDLIKHELSGLPSLVIDFSVNDNNKSVKAFPRYLGYDLSVIFGLPVRDAYYIDNIIGCKMTKTDERNGHIRKEFPSTSSNLPTNINQHVQSIVDYEFTQDALDKNQTRAITIIHKGNVIAEGYQGLLNINKDTPLHGWSMTKSLHAVVIGAAIQQGLFNLNTHAKLEDFTTEQKNEILIKNNGNAVTIGDLIQMYDIIPFEEFYGVFGTVPHMLFASEDAGLFAAEASKTSKRPINNKAAINKEHSINIDWYYSSGVSNILAKEFRSYFESDEEYINFPNKYLFEPCGIKNFIIGVDPSGTFVASSFSYASGRGWGSIGQLMLQNGKWNDKQIVPESFVKFVQIPHEYSGGHYGGSFWLNPNNVNVKQYNYLPYDDKQKVSAVWRTRHLPSDAYMMSGFDGQYNIIIPSIKLVFVRLGWTKIDSDWNRQVIEDIIDYVRFL